MIRTASRIASILALAFALGLMPAWAGPTLDKIKQAGTNRLRCQYRARRVRPAGQPGPLWPGLDIDICKAIAAALFGDPEKVKYVPLPRSSASPPCSRARSTSCRATRPDADARRGARPQLRAVNYYDGQGFMVPKKLSVKSAKELNGATICVQPGTTTELNLADYFRANK